MRSSIIALPPAPLISHPIYIPSAFDACQNKTETSHFDYFSFLLTFGKLTLFVCSKLRLYSLLLAYPCLAFPCLVLPCPLCSTRQLPSLTRTFDFFSYHSMFNLISYCPHLHEVKDSRIWANTNCRYFIPRFTTCTCLFNNLIYDRL